MARHFDYFDDWKTEILECPKCGWKGTFEEGDVGYYEQLMDSSCPTCSYPNDPMLAIVSYPTHDEVEANLDKLSVRERSAYRQRKRHEQLWETYCLRRPEQLPDLEGDEITLIWDMEDVGDDSWTVIRHGDRVVWREPAWYECYPRFDAMLYLLKRKYGRRLVDVEPTCGSWGWLCGDRLASIRWVDGWRAKLRETTPEPEPEARSAPRRPWSRMNDFLRSLWHFFQR